MRCCRSCATPTPDCAGVSRACAQAAHGARPDAAASACASSSCRWRCRRILAGIKTSAVINVGTATIAAFIGAGGYGERIVTGLALNDNATLLAGAIPAAALALLVQGAFEIGERQFGWMARTRAS